jgi:hypothetical protein
MRHLSLIALVLAACGTATDPAVSTETPVVSEDAHGAVHEEADAAHATADAEWASFGAPMASDNTVALSDLLDNPDTYTGQTVRVQGTVADVCQMAGCWMVMPLTRMPQPPWARSKAWSSHAPPTRNVPPTSRAKLRTPTPCPRTPVPTCCTKSQQPAFASRTASRRGKYGDPRSSRHCSQLASTAWSRTER